MVKSLNVEQIERLLGLKKIQKRELAKELGVSQDRVYKWFQNNKIPLKYHEPINEILSEYLAGDTLEIVNEPLPEYGISKKQLLDKIEHLERELADKVEIIELLKTQIEMERNGGKVSKK